MSEALVAFLRARLDEVVDVASSADDGPWWVEDTIPRRWGDERDAEVACSQGTVAVLGYDRNGGMNAEHIALHSPERVLREVEAKRRMLNHYENAVVSLANAAASAEVHDLMTGAANTLRAVLRDHAQIYADHADYREEWRP